MAEAKQKQPDKRSLLFRLVKGFVYGTIIGTIFGTAMYLLAAGVAAIAGNLPITPTQLFIMIFGASVVAGAAKEYSDWLEEQ